jgi:hypothetical protein
MKRTRLSKPESIRDWHRVVRAVDQIDPHHVTSLLKASSEIRFQKPLVSFNQFQFAWHGIIFEIGSLCTHMCQPVSVHRVSGRASRDPCQRQRVCGPLFAWSSNRNVISVRWYPIRESISRQLFGNFSVYRHPSLSYGSWPLVFSACDSVNAVAFQPGSRFLYPSSLFSRRPERGSKKTLMKITAIFFRGVRPRRYSVHHQERGKQRGRQRQSWGKIWQSQEHQIRRNRDYL